MECLNNVVGIRCLNTSSFSGLFIEDLEGINIKRASQIADSSYTSGLDLLNKKLLFSQKAIVNDIQAAFLPYFRINTLIDELTIGVFKNTFLSQSANARGIKFKTRNSRLMRIRIKTISIEIQEADYTSNVSILDGNEQTDFQFTTDSNGKAFIQVEFLSKTNEVFVVIEDVTVTPKSTDIKTGCSCYTKSTEFLIGWGWNGSGTTTSSFGLSVVAASECDNEQLICLLSSKLGFALLYKTGFEIVKEWIASDRLNPVTIIDDGTEEFLLEEFERQYKKQIKTFVESVPRFMSTIDEVCVRCNQSRYMESTP